jgi:hypothetical protein
LVKTGEKAPTLRVLLRPLRAMRAILTLKVHGQVHDYLCAIDQASACLKVLWFFKKWLATPSVKDALRATRVITQICGGIHTYF